MTSQQAKVFVPPPVPVPRAAHWVGDLAGFAVAAVVGAASALRRFTTAGSPDPSGDLMSLARRVENEMPNLAIELRAIAQHQFQGR